MRRRLHFIDATRDQVRPLLRRWRGQLRGAVVSALASPSPREAWAKSLPGLTAASRRLARMMVVEELSRHGRDPDSAWLREAETARSNAERIAALMMGPARAAKLLVAEGIDLDRAMRLVVAVGPRVADAVAWLDVLDVITLDQTRRGAA